MIVVDQKICLRCGVCIALCPVEVLELRFENLKVDNEVCISCADCVRFCPVDALELNFA